MTRALRPRLQIAVCLTALALLAGCAGTTPHFPVPPEQTERATVDGFDPSIRFWSDAPPDNIETTLAHTFEEYRRRHETYYKEHKTYPPLHFLALSGGGNDGAFGAGVLGGWTQRGDRPAFDLVTGVSTGALIAPLAFLGPEYDDKLRALFTANKTDNILLVDLWTFLSGLTGGLSLTDASPFVQQIERTYTPDIIEKIAQEYRKGRRLYVGTTNVEAQRGVIWNMGAIAASDNPDKVRLFHKIIQASAAVPGVFEPVFIDVRIDGQLYNEIHVDGGVTAQVFLYPLQLPEATVKLFKDCGIRRKLYIIRNAKIVPEYQKMNDPGLFSIGFRSVETLIKNNGLGDLYRLYVGAQRDGMDYHVQYIPQDFTVTSKEAFDPAYMQALFDLGQQLGGENAAWFTTPPGADLQPAQDLSARRPRS